MVSTVAITSRLTMSSSISSTVGSSRFPVKPNMVIVCHFGVVFASLDGCGGDLVEPAGGFKQFAGAGAVGGAYQAVAFHQVNQVGGAAVADSHPPLEARRGRLAELEDQGHGIVEESVVFVAGRLEEALHVFGLALRFPEVHYRCGFLFADVGCVETHESRAARRQKEHVPAAQESLCAVGVEDCSRINHGGQAEADARGDVGLDEAGDYVYGGTLCGEYQLNADGASHLS